MDTDENDILATNTFIKNPDVTTNIPPDANQQFRTYYETQAKIQADKKVLKVGHHLRNGNLDELTDGQSLLNTNTFKITQPTNQNVNRSLTDRKTFVSVDSRDRNTVSYSKPNHFKIYLGKDFVNVRKIKLASIEFPNTNAVINSNNNYIYWRNQEDIIDDYTITTNGVVSYPIYSCVLNIGSYIASTLQTEIQTEMSLIRRKQGSSNGNSTIGDFHYFVVSLNISTDIVTITSLTFIKAKINNNPFAVTGGSGVVTVTAQDHGLSTNQLVYIVGANTTSGIDSSVLNGFQLITVHDSSSFTFQVNVNAAQTVSGGGNLVKIGVQAPFQLLWGDQSNTVAQNIGFPLENSSQLLEISITSLENLYQMVINTSGHGLSRTYEYVGQPLTVGYFTSNNLYISYKTFVIQDIPDTNNILVQVTDKTEYSNYVDNLQAVYLQFGSLSPVAVNTYYNYFQETIMVTTSTYHGYTLANINKTIKLYNTKDATVENDTSYDGTYSIVQVPSPTTLVLPGVIYNQNIHSSGKYGNIATVNSLTTSIVYISSVTPNYLISSAGIYYTKITCNTPHNLVAGDKVYFNNLKVTPTFNGSQTISAVLPDANNNNASHSFLIEYNMTSVDNTNIINGVAFIGTGRISVYFPSHGFNQIISITNGLNGSLIIQTKTPHGFLDPNDINNVGKTIVNTVRIMETNTTPSIDGGSYSLTYISPDTFSIKRSPVPFPSITATGNNAGTTTVTTNSTGTTTTIVTQSSTTTTFSSTPVAANPITTTTANTITNITIPTVVTGIIGMSNNFYLYGVTSPTTDVGGIPTTSINGVQFKVRDIIDANNFTFVIPNNFSTSSVTGGGNNIFISSFLHGYTGTQTNTKNDLLNRSINLQGENYAFLTCPQLDTMKNTGSVSNIFARISLDQPPGYVCFSFLSEPKQYNDTPLSNLSELEFSVVNHDNSLYEFNDLDFSFVLEITEVIDTSNLFNHSSRRGIVDMSSTT
jgi:hypothetical protein